MSDSQVQDFLGRARRIERAHRRGHGFVAPGTAGAVRRRRGAGRQSSFIRPFLLVLGCAILLKALLFMDIGQASYEDRIARLKQGSQAEMVGAYLLQADGVTVWLAGFLKDVLKSPM